MEPSQKDLYSVLNVPRTATPEQIRSAYRELTKVFLETSSSHSAGSTKSAPNDRASSSPAKLYSLQDISTAFNVLSNPIKRAEYDAKFSPLVEGHQGSNLNGSADQAGQSKGHSVEHWDSSNLGSLNTGSQPRHPESPSGNPERLGRGNNTEFITNKPAVAFAAGTGLRGPFGVTDSRIAHADSHKLKPMRDMIGPIFSDRRRMPVGVLLALVTGSLSIGIIIALIVKGLIHN